MKWVLILLVYTGNFSVDAIEIGSYTSMIDCFQSREQQLIKLEAWDGFPPINTQLVCLRTDK